MNDVPQNSAILAQGFYGLRKALADVRIEIQKHTGATKLSEGVKYNVGL